MDGCREGGMDGERGRKRRRDGWVGAPVAQSVGTLAFRRKQMSMCSGFCSFGDRDSAGDEPWALLMLGKCSIMGRSTPSCVNDFLIGHPALYAR